MLNLDKLLHGPVLKKGLVTKKDLKAITLLNDCSLMEFYEIFTPSESSFTMEPDRENMPGSEVADYIREGLKPSGKGSIVYREILKEGRIRVRAEIANRRDFEGFGRFLHHPLVGETRIFIVQGYVDLY